MSDRDVDVVLPDGRALRAALRGDPAGAPVLFLHGSPGSRLNRYPFAVAGMREAVQGGEGFAEDFVAFTRPWGVDPADAAVPVVLELGALDVNVPAAHGEWLAARVPGARVVRSAGSGHQSELDVALRRLVAAARLAS